MSNLIKILALLTAGRSLESSRDEDIVRLGRVLREVERERKTKVPDYSSKPEKRLENTQSSEACSNV